MKKLSVEGVNAQLQALPGNFDFITAPRLSQAIGFLVGIRYNAVMIYDMGTGKTKMALDIFRFHLSVGQSKRLLVLVPTTVLVESWALEIKRHAHDLNVLPELVEEEIFRGDYQVVVMTYARFNRLTTETVVNKKTGKNEWKANAERLEKMLELFSSVVFDESTNLSNHRSLTFKTCKSFHSRAWCLALTGTPMGRDPQHLWGQFFAVDGGHTLGYHIGMYRAAFFTEKKRFFGGFDYKFRHQMIPQLQRMMAHSSLRYMIDECTDMPEKTFVPLKITFTEEQWAYYKKAVEKARTLARNKGSMVELKDTFMSMRMLASGFAHIDGRYIDFSPNEKIDHLVTMLGNLDGAKVVVFNVFVHTGDLIAEALKKAKIKFARIYSGTPDKGKQLRRFLDENDCQVFLGNIESTAMGLNLQIARYCVTFEPPASPIVRDQSIRRIWRPGQEHKCVFYDMMVRNSVEEKLYRYLEEGRALFEALIDGNETLY